MSMPNAAPPVIPAHVPPDLVCQFDIYGLAVGDDPQAALARQLLEGPRVFYMPRSMRNPAGFGSWVFTRADDIRAILQDTVHFSSEGIARFDRMTGDGESWRHPTTGARVFVGMIMLRHHQEQAEAG